MHENAPPGTQFLLELEHRTRTADRPHVFYLSNKLGGCLDCPYDAEPMAWLRHRLTRLLALGGAALLLTSCSIIEIDSPLTTFDPAGPNSQQIDNLFWLVFTIATVIFFLVMGALIVILVLFRDRGKKSTQEPKQLHGSPKLEVAWTVIPALILAAIAVPTVSGVFELTGCDTDSMKVDVIGHQWWFEYRYPDYEIETANVLVIPAGEETCLEMTSADVIHNYWVPALMGKRYLIPGQTTLLRMQADEPGEFWGQCAEFCGLSHALMRARVRVVDQTDFDQWVVDQQQPTLLPADGTPEWDGYQVYVNKGCVQCHTVRFDDGDASNIVPLDAFHGPDLTHFASRNVFAGASLPAYGETYEHSLADWLANPPYVKPGSFMPNLSLTAQEIADVSVWLKSNK